MNASLAGGCVSKGSYAGEPTQLTSRLTTLQMTNSSEATVATPSHCYGHLCMPTGQLDALPLGLTSLSEPAGQSDGSSDAPDCATAVSAEEAALTDVAPEPLLEPCLAPELLQQLLQCLLDNWEVI